MTGTAPSVREHGVEAAPLLAALHAAAFADPAITGPAWDAASFASLLEGPGCRALIVAAPEDGASADGVQPLGLLLLRVAADEAEILTLGVMPEARCRGAGTALVEAACQAAVRIGATSLFLEVAESNHRARSLYARCRFVPAGRRRGYFHLGGKPVDALVLRRSLA